MGLVHRGEEAPRPAHAQHLPNPLQGQPARLRSTYLTGASVLGLVSAPVGALMFITAPELVNQDPYGEGWMVVIKPSNIGDVDALLSPGDYKALVEAQPGN